MSSLVADCPRCNASNITFDLHNQVPVSVESGWKQYLEVFCVCRNCSLPTIFSVSQKKIRDNLPIKQGLSNLKLSANNLVCVDGYVSFLNSPFFEPPQFLPEELLLVFKEGTTCMSVKAFNAAVAMFRLCLDLSTKDFLPDVETSGLNRKTRRDLGLRLPWLFANNYLSKDLEELSACIKDDGNDGVHRGTIIKKDAEDVLDFTFALLERLYTQPKKIELAAERRKKRRENET